MFTSKQVHVLTVVTKVYIPTKNSYFGIANYYAQDGTAKVNIYLEECELQIGNVKQG